MCPAGGGRWDEDSSPDGGSTSDSGDRYHDPYWELGQTRNLMAALRTIKEEGGRLHLQENPVVTGPAGGPAKASTPRFSSEYCQGPGASPLSGSRLSIPGSEFLHQPEDLPPRSLHPPFGSPRPASLLCSGPSYPMPFLDAALSLKGYALDHLYDPENLREFWSPATNGPTHYDNSPHLWGPTEPPGPPGPSVIISNGS